MPDGELIVQDSPLTLDPEYKNNLKSWEDHVSAYQHCDNLGLFSSWGKADVLLSLAAQYKEQSLEKFAHEIGVPKGSLINYLRVAKAFPPDKRILNASFTHHFEASRADSLNKKGEWASNKRFDWVEKAADEKMPVSKLVTLISQEKQKEDLNSEIIPCNKCGEITGEIKTFLLYSPGQRSQAVRLELHDPCAKNIEEYARGGVKK